MPYQLRIRRVQKKEMMVEGGRCKEKITEEVIFERPTVEARQRYESL